MKRILRFLKRTAELVCAALFAIMFFAFLIQIFTRYVLNDPVAWSMEVALLAYIWVIFIASATIVSIDEHISFDAIYEAAKPKVKRVLALITSGAILLAFVAALPANYDFVSFMAIDSTWILGIRFDLVYSCFLVFMIGVIVRVLYKIKRLTSTKWRDEV